MSPTSLEQRRSYVRNLYTKEKQCITVSVSRLLVVSFFGSKNSFHDDWAFFSGSTCQGSLLLCAHRCLHTVLELHKNQLRKYRDRDHRSVSALRQRASILPDVLFEYVSSRSWTKKQWLIDLRYVREVRHRTGIFRRIQIVRHLIWWWFNIHESDTRHQIKYRHLIRVSLHVQHRVIKRYTCILIITGSAISDDDGILSVLLDFFMLKRMYRVSIYVIDFVFYKDIHKFVHYLYDSSQYR